MLQYFVDGFFVFASLVAIATIWESCRKFRTAVHLLSRGPEFEVPLWTDVNIGISQPRWINKPARTKFRVMLPDGPAQSVTREVAEPLWG